MSDPLKENEVLESELIEAAIDMFDEMLRMKARLPRAIFEKHLRPRLRLGFLKARHAEAERCEAYTKKGINSPRKIELGNAMNKLEFEVAKLKAK